MLYDSLSMKDVLSSEDCHTTTVHASPSMCLSQSLLHHCSDKKSEVAKIALVDYSDSSDGSQM